MAFGFPMKLTLEHNPPIILRPYGADEMGAVSDLISSYEVCRFTATTSSKVAEQESSWYENTYSDDNSAVWAICIAQNDGDTTGKPIGVTSLGFKNNRGSSGIIIFDRNYWGQGVASRCHRARCFYAHNNLGLKAIDSTVAYPNLGSRKALQRVGYVVTGIEYGKHFADGQPHHLHRLTWVNPVEHKWLEFWGVNKPPTKFQKARILAQSALDLARTEITFL